MQNTTENITEALKQLGFSLESSQANSELDNQMINYRVTVKLNDREVITTDFSLGIGHVNLKAPARTFGWKSDEESILHAWRKNPYADFRDKELQRRVAIKLAQQQKLTPKLADVLYSLCSDGQPYFDAAGFEEWAREFGYDTDSRKAEGIYRACCEIGRQLKRNVPEKTLESVRKLVAEL